MSPEFEKVLHWGGSPVAKCCCGRTHYTASGDFMEDGELERLESETIKDPTKCIPDHDNDSISITNVNGVLHVLHCPCGRLDMIEDYFWKNRETIIGYYRARMESEKKAAASTEQLLSGMPTP